MYCLVWVELAEIPSYCPSLQRFHLVTDSSVVQWSLLAQRFLHSFSCTQTWPCQREMHTWGKYTDTTKGKIHGTIMWKILPKIQTQTCPVWTFCLGCRSSALHQSWGDHRELKIESKEQRRVRSINKDTHITAKNKVMKCDLTMFSIDNWKVVICLMISLSRFTSFTHCAKSWKHNWMS